MSDVMEAVLRSAAAFFVIVVLNILVGKEKKTNLSFFDLITGTAIGGMAAMTAAELNINIWGTIAALLTFVALMMLNGYLYMIRKPLRKALHGEPLLVIYDGRVLNANLARAGYSLAELNTLLKKQGYDKISDINYAVIGADGVFKELVAK